MSTTRQTLSAVQRATTHGLGSLTDSELLTLALLGEYEQDWRRYQDDFDSLLSHHGGLKALTGATHPLQPADGPPPTTPPRLQAILQLHLRISAEELQDSPLHANNPSNAAAIFIPHLGALQEETLMVMPISDDFVPAPIRTVAVGQLNTVQATPAQIFRPALEANAPAAIFIAHNHPQTDPQPSADDWTFTLQMLRAAALLRITIHDHLVISGNRYRSMRQENEAPFTQDHADLQTG